MIIYNDNRMIFERCERHCNTYASLCPPLIIFNIKIISYDVTQYTLTVLLRKSTQNTKLYSCFSVDEGRD